MAVKDNGVDAVIGVLDRSEEILREEIILQLTYLGEESVTRARQDHPGNWMDRTGNLRSSIGYAVFEYGRTVMQSAFAQVAAGGAGSAKGADYVQSLADEYAKTYALVVVAGMEYADFVELKRDVLQGAEAAARQVCDERIKRGIQAAVERINSLLR